MILKIFIDTEFTDFIDSRLISIGLVAATSEEFYAEVPYSMQACSEFVKDRVIPLLGREPLAACSDNDELRVRLMTWLKLVRYGGRGQGGELQICFDYRTDWDLFVDAVDNSALEWCIPLLVNSEINELLRYEYHQKNNLPEHHALYDARANCYAYRERPPFAS